MAGSVLTEQQQIVARQVDQFWRERGWLPAVVLDTVSRVHATGRKGETWEGKALCKWTRLIKVAEGTDLLNPPCRRCLKESIYLNHNIKVQLSEI